MKTAAGKLQHRALAAGLGLALMASAGTMNATTTVVEIGPNFIQSLLNQINTYMARAQDYAEYGQEAVRWTQQFQHLQQQLIQLQGFMAVSMPMVESFEEVAENQGIEECRGDGSITSWAEVFRPDMNAEITRQQVTVCQKLVLAHNKKHNETVQMLKRLRDRATEFQSIEARRGSVGTSQGLLDANDNDVHRFTSRVQMDLDYWHAMMTAYDSYIVSLNRQQQDLARRALNGQPNVFGTVMQGVTLKAALEAAGSRER